MAILEKTGAYLEREVMEECLSSRMCLIRANLKVHVQNTPNSEPTEKALGFKRHLMGPVVSRQLSC